MKQLKNIKGKEAIKAFIKAGGIQIKIRREIMEYIVLIYQAVEGGFWA